MSRLMSDVNVVQALITGDAELVDAVHRCYASAFGTRIAAYRENLDGDGLRQERFPSLAVVVQRMQPSRAAGVAFSADPLTGQRCVIVEAARGRPDAVVGPCALAEFRHHVRVEQVAGAHRRSSLRGRSSRRSKSVSSPTFGIANSALAKPSRRNT